jgi:hypothetical protein
VSNVCASVPFTIGSSVLLTFTLAVLLFKAVPPNKAFLFIPDKLHKTLPTQDFVCIQQ